MIAGLVFSQRAAGRVHPRDLPSCSQSPPLPIVQMPKVRLKEVGSGPMSLSRNQAIFCQTQKPAASPPHLAVRALSGKL